MPLKVWIDGKLVNKEDAKISVYDHGFLYGDGIYETVHAYGYKVFHWPDHYHRLLESARRIALLLKAGGLTAVLLALSEPRITVYETKVAAAILVDTSASVTPQDLAHASDLATQMEA